MSTFGSNDVKNYEKDGERGDEVLVGAHKQTYNTQKRCKNENYKAT